MLQSDWIKASGTWGILWNACEIQNVYCAELKIRLFPTLIFPSSPSPALQWPWAVWAVLSDVCWTCLMNAKISQSEQTAPALIWVAADFEQAVLKLKVGGLSCLQTAWLERDLIPGAYLTPYIKSYFDSYQYSGGKTSKYAIKTKRHDWSF